VSRLEDDIRAATRDRAAEITPEGIPPLELAHVPAAGRRRRWLPAVAAAAAVVAIAGTVAGVSASHGRTAATPRTRRSEQITAPKPPAAATAAARLDNQVLGLYLPATGPQYEAGTQLYGTIQALQVADAVRCLARHGVTVRVPPVASMAPRYALNYVDNSVFPDLARIARTRDLSPAWFIQSLRPAAGQGHAFHRWLGPCQSAARAVFTPLESAGQRLEGNNAWTRLSFQAPSAPPVRATLPALRRCAARYGWPSSPYGAAGPIRTFSDFGDWVFGHLDGADSRGASAAQLRRLNARWSVIFVRCGRPPLAAQDHWLGARQPAFVRQHQAQVRAVEALARAALARAEHQAR
jgi:hypothetical protein